MKNGGNMNESKKVFWATKVKEYEDSHLSIKDFCQNAQVNRNTFVSWRLRIKKNTSNFQKISTIPPREEIIVIRYPHGVSIEIKQGLSIDFFKSLIFLR